MDLIDIFKTLVKIPSPSLFEDDVARKIIELLDVKGIETRKDPFGNVYAVYKGKKNGKNLLLSAHMDVVGDDTPPNIVDDGVYIQTDKKRTLGADDKAGVSAIIALLLDVAKSENPDYGSIEALFTKDEENSMSGIHHVEFDKINSEYALVLDSDKLGNFEISGAGYLKLTITVKTPFGGHSGLDIADKTRLNAAKLIAEIVECIPQGVYKSDSTGVLTSINLGSVVAGGVENSVCAAVEKGLKGPDIAEFVAKNSMSNIINTRAFAHYSLRSSDIKAKDDLISEIQAVVEKFNSKYLNAALQADLDTPLASAALEIEEHLPIFEKSDDDFLIKIAQKAASKSGIALNIRSFHAGAETHIFANRKNSSNLPFKPVLAGIADVYNMHSPDEKIDVESYKKGYEFLKKFVETFFCEEM